MDRSLYIAMTAAKHNMLSQTLHSNNLANASTTGFRADFEQSRAMPVFGDIYASRAYAMTERPSSDFSQGSVISTGRALDFAIKGDGWIAVEAPDGTEAYTRAGDLKIDETGILRNGNGFPVLGNGGPIAVPPHERMEVGMDGVLTIQPLGAEPIELNVTDRIRLVNPPLEDLEKGTDGLFRSKGDAEVLPDLNVKIVSGGLESSNVNVVSEMTGIISAARNFELNLKYIRTLKSSDEATARILQQ